MKKWKTESKKPFLGYLKKLYKKNGKKDGPPYYSFSTKKINGVQQVVNHIIWHKNIDGFHTKNFENLWTLMKYEIRKRNGVLFRNIFNFLNEFNFRY